VKRSSKIPGECNQVIDSTLAMLGSAQPRAGLEQRVMAHLQMAPRLAWYRHLSLAPAGRHRWMMATASGVIVLGAVTMSGIHHRQVMVRPPIVQRRQPLPQPAAAAATVGISNHPLQPNTVHTRRHRGISRSARAMHPRVPLPPGTAAPLRPALSGAR
jgi:hypothetical protein